MSKEWGNKGVESAKLTEEQADELIWCWKNGDTVDMIARKFGISTSTVKNYINQYIRCPWGVGKKMWVMHLGSPVMATVTEKSKRGQKYEVTMAYGDKQTESEEWHYFQVLHEAALKKLEEGKHEQRKR